MIKFEKVSFEEYKEALFSAFGIRKDENVREIYDNIKIPIRSTSGSGGYDFFAPFPINIPGGNYDKEVIIPSGIRFVTDRDDVVLLCFPRSGQGFKYGVALLNTVGVIDSDYWCSDNGGHIWCKLHSKRDMLIPTGSAYMQGIIVPFLKTDDDVSKEKRNGGFGSTDK